VANESTQRDGTPQSWTESDRLAALWGYDILDTPPEEVFDDLARLAGLMCNAPVALVNFITEKRQWFKAEIGLGRRETPLDIAFCTHVILQPHLFVVPDTTKDARFNCNPLVTGEPHFRFYAGSPLLGGSGLPLGTLCVLDYVPRPGLTAEQGEVLLTLARHGSVLLECRRALKDIHRSTGESKDRPDRHE
jgi:GAF domain-containing protein